MTYDTLREQKMQLKKQDRITFDWMILLSILFHIIILYMIMPDFQISHRFGKQETNFIAMQRYKPPPPPKQEEPEEKVKKKKKKVLAKPIPEPMVEDIQDIQIDDEDDLEIVYDDSDLDFEEPEAPPDGPLRVGGDVKQPEIIRRVDPDYPALARRARIEGLVILECIISKDGVVRDVKVIKTLNSMMDEAAIKAVKQWQFKPGTQNDIPVDVIMNLTVIFKLS